MFRLLRLCVVLLVLLVLAGAVDRVALHFAQSRVANSIQDSEHLNSKPTVTIHGFPFLTQLFRGEYDHVDVTMDDFERAGVHLAEIEVALHGVHLPFGDVVRNNVKRVPVDRVEGTGLMTYDELARQVGRGLRFGYVGNGAVRVSVAGGTVSEVTTPAVQGRTLTIGTPVGAVTVHVPALPFRLQVEAVRATADGVRIVVVAHKVVINVGS